MSTQGESVHGRRCRDREAQVCGRGEVGEDGVLNVGQAVKDVIRGLLWESGNRISGGVSGETSMTCLAAGATTYTDFFPYIA